MSMTMTGYVWALIDSSSERKSTKWYNCDISGSIGSWASEWASDARKILKENIAKKNKNRYVILDNSKDNADAEIANKLSLRINTLHHNIKVTSENFLSLLDELILYLDEPLYDSSMVASYLLSKSAQRNKIKVLLAGNGADEIFGGYHRHYKTIKSLAKGKLSMF